MTGFGIDPRLRGKTFICGVGVQKAGTSWLYSYLANRTEISMSGRKELHYFDGLLGTRSRTPIETWAVQNLQRLLESHEPGTPMIYTEKLMETVDVLRMQYDETAYAGYFARIAKDKQFFGEVTPSYCLIGSDGFRYMKSLFPRIRVIYLMRDPVDRHYSLLSMAESRRRDPGYAQRNFLALLERGFPRSMSDYRSHVEALRSVFSDEELFIGFYENLFSDDEIRRLCNFIGIPFQTAPYEKRVNTFEKNSGLGDEVARTAQKLLAPTYEYCRANFPDLPSSWRA